MVVDFGVLIVGEGDSHLEKHVVAYDGSAAKGQNRRVDLCNVRQLLLGFGIFISALTSIKKTPVNSISSYCYCYVWNRPLT